MALVTVSNRQHFLTGGTALQQGQQWAGLPLEGVSLPFQMMDANQRWDVPEDHGVDDKAGEFKPLWIEPSPDDILGHAAISKVEKLLLPERWSQTLGFLGLFPRTALYPREQSLKAERLPATQRSPELILYFVNTEMTDVQIFDSPRLKQSGGLLRSRSGGPMTASQFPLESLNQGRSTQTGGPLGFSPLQVSELSA